eukprot:CAMPEP_0197928914 /NCGR_PEP_ID=MMETSP1439-20131203/103084_1 /TAXON_ID=66791 /ORGANISM="Gonyaulax spinifera, Strain CCMP409" /LENGTH=193 /DNA_ID=CAMNT_0043551539 /DNA_START=50 /DNA_END=632 /DNA_ORIENTATION=-
MAPIDSQVARQGGRVASPPPRKPIAGKADPEHAVSKENAAANPAPIVAQGATKPQQAQPKQTTEAVKGADVSSARGWLSPFATCRARAAVAMLVAAVLAVLLVLGAQAAPAGLGQWWAWCLEAFLEVQLEVAAASVLSPFLLGVAVHLGRRLVARRRRGVQAREKAAETGGAANSRGATRQREGKRVGAEPAL